MRDERTQLERLKDERQTHQATLNFIEAGGEIQTEITGRLQPDPAATEDRAATHRKKIAGLSSQIAKLELRDA